LNAVKKSLFVATTGTPLYESPIWVGTDHAQGKLSTISSYFSIEIEFLGAPA
jgi:hypothetical protein